MIQDFWANAAFSITPTILVGLIFWLVMYSIFRADRTERKTYAEIEADEREKRGLAPRSSLPKPTTDDSAHPSV